MPSMVVDTVYTSRIITEVFQLLSFQSRSVPLFRPRAKPGCTRVFCSSGYYHLGHFRDVKWTHKGTLRGEQAPV